MSEMIDLDTLSSRRARLASFDHAYAVALRVRRATGRHQCIIRTGNPLQPVRVSGSLPKGSETLLALIV